MTDCYRHQSAGDSHEGIATAQSLDRRLIVSIGLNGVIVVAEVVGGFASGSLALLSDAMHNLSDVAALAVALVARRLGRQPPSLRHTYGLRRVEVLAALLNAAVLLVVCTLILREAVLRFTDPQPIRGGLMLTVALVGLVANLASVVLLKGHQHGDLNMRGAFLHLVQDTLSSVVVVVAAILSGWRFGVYLDPIASILVVLMVIRGTWRLVRDTVQVLLEAVPPGLDLESLHADIQRRFPISDMHHVHVWQLGSGFLLLTAHIRLPDMSLSEIEKLLAEIRRHLADAWSIEHCTLEPDTSACTDEGLLQRPGNRALAAPRKDV